MFVTGRARMLSWAAIAVTALSTTVLFSGTADAAPPVTLGGGSGIYVEQLDDPNSTADCTLTSIGYDRDGKLVGITAGHCGEVGARIAAEYTRSGGIGVISEKSAGNDWAVIVFDPARVNPTKQVAQSVINSVGALPHDRGHRLQERSHHRLHLRSGLGDHAELVPQSGLRQSRRLRRTGAAG